MENVCRCYFNVFPWLQAVIYHKEGLVLTLHISCLCGFKMYWKNIEVLVPLFGKIMMLSFKREVCNKILRVPKVCFMEFVRKFVYTRNIYFMHLRI